MENQYEKGQWLIRKWSKECGGERDFIKFNSSMGDNVLHYSKMVRIKKKKVIDIFPAFPGECTYLDSRMSTQIRIATGTELVKLGIALINHSQLIAK